MPWAGHPRVGGEQRRGLHVVGHHTGSSPRGRGTEGPRQAAGRLGRVIPAWAGNRPSRVSRSRTSTGHPRVGGEQAPRQHLPRQRQRVIPAWAGNRGAVRTMVKLRPGHPRVGGEQSVSKPVSFSQSGSSPRGRGTDDRRELNVMERRVIPAWAGNRHAAHPRERGHAGHPRVGGEQARKSSTLAKSYGSSPRGRGTGHRAGGVEGHFRVIPAWAGNRSACAASTSGLPGHPRVGGEQSAGRSVWARKTGSSPRGRGTGHRGR